MEDLTPREKKVVEALRNGAELITSCDITGAWVSGYGKDFKIGNKVFFSLVEKGYIRQMLGPPFYYVLSENSGINL